MSMAQVPPGKEEKYLQRAFHQASFGNTFCYTPWSSPTVLPLTTGENVDDWLGCVVEVFRYYTRLHKVYFVSPGDWPRPETGHWSGGWSFCYLVSISFSEVHLKQLPTSFEFQRRDVLERRLGGTISHGAVPPLSTGQSLSYTLPGQKAWCLLLLLASICYSCRFGSFPSDYKFVAREWGRCLVIQRPWPTD